MSDRGHGDELEEGKIGRNKPMNSGEVIEGL